MGMELQPPTCVDHYADLGVSPDASTQEIRRAFYKLAKETHPDKNNNESTHTPRFRKVNSTNYPSQSVSISISISPTLYPANSTCSSKTNRVTNRRKKHTSVYATQQGDRSTT
ncbi:hypothetical protein RRF57_006069 [Xylaria bambusicola]|uniref:J domain-containing protein n=1 Tax=Xylaria bambusicola TaxID=326684 RepID=A0AAN7UN61_9PEZI